MKFIIKNKCYRNLLILFVILISFPLIQKLLNSSIENFQSQNEDLQSLRKQVETLRKTYTETKDNLDKCMSKETIKKSIKKIEEAGKINNTLNKKLTDKVANQGSSCKKLSEYNIEEHPEFKKRNYHKPCRGCNI